jgi:hypothetical protein
VLCGHCGHGSEAEAALGELRDCPLAPVAGDPGVDGVRHVRVRMAGEHRDLGGGQAVLERGRDERMAQVMQSDRLEELAPSARHCP